MTLAAGEAQNAADRNPIMITIKRMNHRAKQGKKINTICKHQGAKKVKNK